MSEATRLEGKTIHRLLEVDPPSGSFTLRPARKILIDNTEKLLVITGGPGVGKTTLVNSLLHILRIKKVEVALCATTKSWSSALIADITGGRLCLSTGD